MQSGLEYGDRAVALVDVDVCLRELEVSASQRRILLHGKARGVECALQVAAPALVLCIEREQLAILRELSDAAGQYGVVLAQHELGEQQIEVGIAGMARDAVRGGSEGLQGMTGI